MADGFRTDALRREEELAAAAGFAATSSWRPISWSIALTTLEIGEESRFVIS